MIEEVLATARYNPKIDPTLGIWTWEISFYLLWGHGGGDYAVCSLGCAFA